MGTKPHQSTLPAASVAANTSTEATGSAVEAPATIADAARKLSTHDTNGCISNSNNKKSVSSNTHCSNKATNTICPPTSSTATTTTTTTTVHHSKAQVIIIPATSASTVATNAAKKIRRAFSMPRNPFQWSRKFKTNNGVCSDVVASGDGGSGRGSNSTLTACVGGGGRHGSVVSLNSYTVVCKDAKGDGSGAGGDGNDDFADRPTTQATTMPRRDKKTKSEPGTCTNAGAHRVFRRSSLRKFINRIAQHVSASVNIGASKQASTQANSLSSADRVPPIGGYQWPPDQTPGVMGLKNHGNTCFMNAVLQCLSHTDILAEYFVLDQYKSDLKRRNKINSRKFGTKGELTEQLANVLKALWTCKNESDHSTSFKAVVDRYGSQFRSSTQHDAQEFLFWLLDKVHEDLNTATKRRYKSVKNTYGRPDEVIAAETLANHIRCNNSFVQAVFQAQFRSSLTCPRCKKQSNTFDPFHCISVQLPQLSQQTVFVTVVYSKQLPRLVKLGVTVPAGSPIIALREQLHADTGIASESMVLVDINETGFARVYYDSQPISTLADVDNIYCIEVPPPESEVNEINKNKVNNAKTNGLNNAAVPVVGTSTTSASSTTITTTKAKTTTARMQASTDLLLLVANVRRHKNIASDMDSMHTADSIERFGTPFCLRAPRDATYTELQKKLLREQSSLLKPEVFAYTKPLTEMFQIRLQDPSADPDTYLEQVEHPLLTEMIDLALSVLSAEAGPPHVKLLLEWPDPEAHFVDPATSPPLVEHESVARLLEQRSQGTTALTLEQCLEHYTKAETLSAEDAWRCPHCQQYLPVVKTLGLWSLPDILVVHFKRFRQHQSKGSNAAKLTTMVKFPLNAFDMSPHLAKGTRENHVDLTLNGAAPAGHYRPSSWKKSTRGSDSRSSTLESIRKETRYDLYAVCYHQGDTLETGHYTAACKNPYDHQWYKFDDQRVTRVPNDSIEEEIINNEAYMLFYQRRQTDATECSGSSSTSGEHWVSKIAPPPPSSIVSSGERPTAAVCTVPMSDEITEKSDEILSQRLDPKPVIMQKIENAEGNHIEAVDAVTTSQVPKRDSLVQLVLSSTLVGNTLADTESLKYADDGPEEADADIDELDILEKLTTAKEESPNEEEANDIFVMDENCKLKTVDKNTSISSNPAKEATQKLFHTAAATSTPIKNKPPLTTVAVNDIAMKSTASASISNESSCLPNSLSHQESRISNGALLNSSPDSSSSSETSVPLSSRSSPHLLHVISCNASEFPTKFSGCSAASIPSTASAALSDKKCSESLLSSSLKNSSSSIIAAASAVHASDLQLLSQRHHPYVQHWHGSRSSVSAVEHAINSQQSSHTHTHCLNLRHSFSTSSNYKLKECSDTLSSMLRNSANTCSKDTLIFIDQQSHHNHHHSLMEDDDDTFVGSRSLWISPVTPHKLITVSPKN